MYLFSHIAQFACKHKFNLRMNIFYAIEWVVFAGFSVFLWWRLVADAHRRSFEDDDDYYYDDDDDDDGDTVPGRPAPTSEVQK